jgi:lipoprotein-anchoring transpeptidase ErfK/SrfK
MMRRTSTIAAVLLLAACSSGGTDSDQDRQAPDESVSAGPQGPDFAEFEQANIPDLDPRPLMQVQVVLDRRGFGPGVIDGAMDLSTRNALKGFQEANGLDVTGGLDAATQRALDRWEEIPATRVVRIPESWGELEFADVPEEYEDQAKLDHLGYESLGEKLAERFHTTVEVLQELNPAGRPAGAAPEPASTAAAEGVPAYPPRTRVSPTPLPTAAASEAAPEFRPGQLVRVPNVGAARIEPGMSEDEEWQRTLASLGVSGEQPRAARVVVDKSESWLKAYDAAGKLLAMYTVTSGSGRDPLPLGEWGITVVDRNPPFRFDPDLFWDVPDSEEEQHLPPGPNGPVGVAWIDLTKEHYGIHGTPEPQNIGVTQSHGCVRLTNWDAARLAGMVSTSTEVVFQA